MISWLPIGDKYKCVRHNKKVWCIKVFAFTSQQHRHIDPMHNKPFCLFYLTGVMSGWWTSSTKDTHNFTLLLLYTNIMSEKFECSISICGQSISEQSWLSVLWQIDRNWVEYYSTDACFPLAWYFSVSLMHNQGKRLQGNLFLLWYVHWRKVQRKSRRRRRRRRTRVKADGLSW